ncbi:hypothetical protein KBX73_10305 [Acetobacter persici]|nr:hypothetical protein [Acetobacter persici]
MMVCGEINFSGINSVKKKISPIFLEKPAYCLDASVCVLHQEKIKTDFCSVALQSVNLFSGSWGACAGFFWKKVNLSYTVSVLLRMF